MNLGLKDCKAFIAGASKGLGKACAKALADEGARVFICARNKQALKQAASEFGAAGYSAADVSLLAKVKRVVAEAITALGGLDCLVTNAGGPPTARGRIVNLTGYGVKEPLTDLVVSDSVRAGVTVMAKTIATDLAPYGITVNNIAPGPIMTDRLIEILSARAKTLGMAVDEQFKLFSETIPLRRMGKPNEIGDLCAYLCSLQAGYLTGQTIVVDGGINRSI